MERSELQQQIDALEAKRAALTGPENKNKRKKIATKLKKLTESLAALSIVDSTTGRDNSGPALPASSGGGSSASPPACPKGHPMTSSDFAEGDYKTGWHCDVCGKFGAARTQRWFCKTCPFDLCKNCPGASASSAQDAGHGEDEDDDDDGNSDDERPDLLRQIAALEAKLAAGDAVKTEQRAALEAEAASLRETVRDLDKFDELQAELDTLQKSKNASAASAARAKAIEAEMDKLEEKHRKQTEAKLAKAASELGKPEPPAGITFLTMRTAKRRAKVQVTSDERWARFQCAESTKLSRGASTLFWDDSKGGKERKAGLGLAGRIVELDRSDASAKIKFASGKTAWFPVAALSLAEGESSGSEKSTKATRGKKK